MGTFTANLDRRRISEQVVHFILEQIRQGELRPGERLPPERELAARLGVGRPSLREALRALATLGVLRIQQGDGIYISSLDPETLLAPLQFFMSLTSSSLESLFEARRVLEPGIAALAAQRADDLTKIESLVQHGSSAIDNYSAFIEIDIAFHQAIAEAARNPYLERMNRALHTLTRASSELTGRISAVRKQSHIDHQAILRALQNHNPSEAAKAMEEHLEHVWQGYSEAKHGSRS